MRRLHVHAILLGIVMFVAAGLTLALTPTKHLGEERKIDLEALVPERFGEWTMDPGVVALIVSPDAQAIIDKIYSQTLARTYVNSRGERIMLSIAYGGDQSDSMQVHRPEVCYAGQGFQIVDSAVGYMSTNHGDLPVKRLLAKKGARNEPITYWITVGDQATHTGLAQKLVQLRYGLTGTVPDGMLVRVSTISADQEHAYRLQDAFVKDMLGALPQADRARLAGVFGARS
jgi:EpsI family protein